MSDGLLIIGHGTRNSAGQGEFSELVEQVRALGPELVVEGCFLELAQPTIAQGLATLVSRGARRVSAMPLVLFAAGHAKRDIPQALAQAADEHSGLEVEQLAHLGCHAAVVELSERRFFEALGDKIERGAANSIEGIRDTLLVLVGRGSHDAEATAEMRRFAACRARRLPSVPIEIAFIAMAQPRVETVLDQVARSAYRRILVQPHLLFSGELASELCGRVDRMGRLMPEKDWLVADHLGPDGRLATAILDNLTQNSCSAANLARTKPPGPAF